AIAIHAATPAGQAAVKRIPVIHAFVVFQQHRDLVNRLLRRSRLELQASPSGAQNVADRDHIALPPHLSFWRSTSENDISGSIASGKVVGALRMRMTSPLRILTSCWPSTVKKTSCPLRLG